MVAILIDTAGLLFLREGIFDSLMGLTSKVSSSLMDEVTVTLISSMAVRFLRNSGAERSDILIAAVIATEANARSSTPPTD